VNFLDEIDKWVMTDTAPVEMTAYWVDEKFNPTGSRRICAYPEVAEYDGKGDPRDVSSFRCVQTD
jgi:feruloyl esterase